VQAYRFIFGSERKDLGIEDGAAPIRLRQRQRNLDGRAGCSNPNLIGPVPQNGRNKFRIQFRFNR